MKLLTTSDVPAKYLARIALDCKLYQSKTWNLYSAFQQVVKSRIVEENAEIILLNNNDDDAQRENFVGVIYHNDSFPIYCCNTQVYVKPEHRMNGYGKKLYKELNARLIEKGITPLIEVGYGISGSGEFWYKMSKLPDTLKQEMI